MTEDIYKPRNCAFHPKQLIFNFCKNSECLLPLCPSCVKVHSEEHKNERTYGQFQNIHKVVHDLHSFYTQTTKELANYSQDILDHQKMRSQEQKELNKRIGQAKSKMITLVERFFTDFEKEVQKSIICYNESMKENYTKVQEHINQIHQQVQDKSQSLSSDKVLKTLIGFHAKFEEQRYIDQLDSIKCRIDYLDTQKVQVICQPAANQKVIDQLGNYLHLSYQNWQQDIKYVAEFVKTGFTNNSDISQTLRL